LPPIIIINKLGAGPGHHGGAWKVAFADFTTAMMAFFLLLWLLATTDEVEKKAIAGYFNDPGGALIGPGGANTGVIEFDYPQGQREAPVAPPVPDLLQRGESLQNSGEGQDSISAIDLSAQAVRQQYERQEQAALEQLKQELQAELERIDSAFAQLKDQILIDYTALGLRVQIVDKDKRPMFDLGSANLKSYSRKVLEALAPLLDSVPNRISVTGHTDAVSFGKGAFYTNWELSSDRANSARRSLLDGGYPEAKMLTVQGMGDAAPFKPEAPNDPINRRIAIIVLKKSVEDALLGRSGVGSDHVIESEGKALAPLRGEAE
jgi:chemotaxis protein MotB